MTSTDPDEQARQFATQALAANDPTGWFEPLYAAAENGGQRVPWDRGEPQRILVEWATAHALDGTGRRALVVGCGFGEEPEYLVERGFTVTGFDISPTAIRAARDRFPDSAVEYRVADLLDRPREWHGAFDFVFEAYTVQSLPRELHPRATAAITEMVAPGGRLLVVAVHDEHGAVESPPWPLTRSEIDAFTADGLRAVHVDEVQGTNPSALPQWRVELQRRVQ